MRGLGGLRAQWRAAADTSSLDHAADRVESAGEAVAEEVALSAELARGLDELAGVVLAVAERRLGTGG